MYEAIYSSDSTQTGKVVFGAFLLALGLFTTAFIALDWWSWKKCLQRPVQSDNR